MRRARTKLAVDGVLAASAFVTFASGLVLLLGLHAGRGALRTSALGLDRLVWLDLHRLPALVMLAALTFHLALDWKAFAAKFGRVPKRERRGPVPEHLHGTRGLICLAVWAAAITGVASWLAGGSGPTRGPEAGGVRHHLVDVHFIFGLAALPWSVHHLGHRWRWMVRVWRAWRS
ncbi:MAG: DUF4405 domain-containing protein [Deltaproteobacteria bacterium]|nr:DUF4405 domain-containing protein [Deltaproteobacteria bacterium]